MRFVTSIGLVTMMAASGSAHADDASSSGTPVATGAEVPGVEAPAAEKLEYGADVRLRSVWMPGALVGLFVDRQAGGTQNWGYGFDLVRRRGNLELQLGFEYERLQLKEGVYINSGDTVPADTADFILSPDHAPNGESFGWYTIEFTFLNHAPINKYVAIRYGGGAGLGILSGGVYRYDTQCAAGATNSNPEPGCRPMMYGGTATAELDDKTGAPELMPKKYDLGTPVFVVVNAIIGVQIRPTPKAVINIEGGIRTMPFFGMSVGYFFN